MGYGVVSIVGYLIFLIWVVASRPGGPNTMPTVGTGVAGFASMMASAFSIQGFFIPVLKSYNDSRKHIYILFVAYLIGIGCYYYIAYMGAFGTFSFIFRHSQSNNVGIFADHRIVLSHLRLVGKIA